MEYNDSLSRCDNSASMKKWPEFEGHEKQEVAKSLHQAERVRFSNVVRAKVYQYERELISARWYSRMAIKRMKKETARDAKLWSRKDPSSCRLLDCVFGDTNKVMAQRCMNAFSMLDIEPSLRGVERYVNKHHAEIRDDKKDDAIWSILDEQDALREEGLTLVGAQQHLAELSRRKTCDAALFARQAAIADEIAVKRDDPTSLAHRFIDVASRKNLRYEGPPKKPVRQKSNDG